MSGGAQRTTEVIQSPVSFMPIFARSCQRMRGEARFVQDRIEEVAGAVACKRPASAIGAVCARGKPERKDTRLGITEGWYRSSPIFPIGVGATSHARDLNAMVAQTRTEFAGYYLCIQRRERFRGSGHGNY